MKKNILVLCLIGSMLFTACGAFEGYGRIKVSWFVGLGAGLLPDQIKVERNVVDQFNRSQDKIWLVLDVAPSMHDAYDGLQSKIASGNDVPDVVGPVGWSGSNAFHGQWLDMTSYLEKSNYDMSVFNPNLVKFYQTEEGTVGLPFAVYPDVIFFNKQLFDRAGLAYPPEKYGEDYKFPDGTQAEWSWDTVTHLAKLLTLDKDGKNATEVGFDRKNIVQYGYYPQSQSPAEIGSFWGAAQPYEGSKGKFVVHLPGPWMDAWKWYFNGMWGPEAFIPNGTIAHDVNKSNGNPFGYGIVAMAIAPLWYPSCCLSLPDGSWDMAALPTYQGVVHGRVQADTFRILKNSPNAAAAFEVMKYLIGPASSELLDAYGGMPGRTDLQEDFFKAQKKKFPSVKNWDVLQAGLSYPDIPNAEQYIPNGSEAYPRIFQFVQLLETQENADFDLELQKLKIDLQKLFNKE